MAKGKLPEGYRGVEKLIKEFRDKNPKGKIETAPVLVGDGFILITAKITSDDGAVGSGISEADIQEEKEVQKAESGAIRRALLTLGYDSVESDEEVEEAPKSAPKEERKSFKREEPKNVAKEIEEPEEKPKSRFGSKDSDSKKVSEGDSDQTDIEGTPKFQRGSRFKRN